MEYKTNCIIITCYRNQGVMICYRVFFFFMSSLPPMNQKFFYIRMPPLEGYFNFLLSDYQFCMKYIGFSQFRSFQRI